MNHDESYLHIWNSTFSEIVGGSNFFLVLTYMSNCDLPQSFNRSLGKKYDRVFQIYRFFFLENTKSQLSNALSIVMIGQKLAENDRS